MRRRGAEKEDSGSALNVQQQTKGGASPHHQKRIGTKIKQSQAQERRGVENPDSTTEVAAKKRCTRLACATSGKGGKFPSPFVLPR